MLQICNINAQISSKYDYIEERENNLHRVSIVKDNNTYYGYVNEQGKEIVPPIYDGAEDALDGTICVTLNNKYGFYNKDGKQIVAPKYDFVPIWEDIEWGELESFFRNGYVICYLNEQACALSLGGNEVIPLGKYKDIGWYPSEGFFIVENDKMGFADKTGNVAIPLIYDYVYGFCEGVACVKLNEKWGFIDKTGKTIIPFKYDDINVFNFDGCFEEGFLNVTLNGKEIKIDKKGNEYPRK
jgi:hypothetical protein